MDSSAGYRVFHVQRAEKRTGYHQRDRPLHRLAGPGPGLQSRTNENPRTARDGAADAGAEVRYPRVPRRRTVDGRGAAVGAGAGGSKMARRQAGDNHVTMIALNFNDTLADRAPGATALLEFGGQGFDVGQRHRQAADRRDTLACPPLDLPAHSHGCGFGGAGGALRAHTFTHRSATIGTETSHSGRVNDARGHFCIMPISFRGPPSPSFEDSPGLPMGFADPVSLHGRHVSLVPLSHSHHDDLVEAVKDGELWALWYTKIPAPEG